MKITVIHPDSKQRRIRFSERHTTKVSTLFKRLPRDVVIKRQGQTINISKECLIREAFIDGDIIEAVYTPVPETRRLWKCIKRSNDQCMITLDKDEQRAEMPCGHAITPQALFDYCWHKLDQGCSTITCPYIADIKGNVCGFKWSSRDVKLSAAMSRREKILFQTRLDKNRIKQQELESTNEYPDAVMISLLHNSPKLQRHGDALMRRACPKCWSIIEHVSGCLCMTCQYPSCNFRFCFRCLDEYVLGIDHSKCHRAPLQFSCDK
ncbi:uncharacterized protein LOC132561607 [Ylistrum balloti]|uniref:uncharacterized protein LOC132561607 n=1 Tax=Ylistrum balloti TaxID=509963 RepID=UPI002905B366|nr:uncharacterized protein LOC132561607 [Ylistrum balloti]